MARAMLGTIWQFLKDHDNLAVIVAIAGGAWAVFTLFANKSEKETKTTSVTANHGDIAAGRDITGPVNTKTHDDSKG
jgi:hypothetical protein